MTERVTYRYTNKTTGQVIETDKKRYDLAQIRRWTEEVIKSEAEVEVEQYPTEATVRSWNVAQLDEYASKNGITFDAEAKKADKVDIVIAFIHD